MVLFYIVYLIVCSSASKPVEIYRKFDTSSGTSSLILERQTVHISDDAGRIAMLEKRIIGTDDSPPSLTRYVYSNHLQSASLELDEYAEIISYEEYHPYGTTAFQAKNTSINAVAKRYRYTGKERDDESGLYYHGARYYIPWLCRWVSVDALQNDMPMWSPYNYGFCNPVSFNDPSGNNPEGDKPKEGDTKVDSSGQTLKYIQGDWASEGGELKKVTVRLSFWEWVQFKTKKVRREVDQMIENIKSIDFNDFKNGYGSFLDGVIKRGKEWLTKLIPETSPSDAPTMINPKVATLEPKYADAEALGIAKSLNSITKKIADISHGDREALGEVATDAVIITSAAILTKKVPALGGVGSVMAEEAAMTSFGGAGSAISREMIYKSRYQISSISFEGWRGLEVGNRQFTFGYKKSTGIGFSYRIEKGDITLAKDFHTVRGKFEYHYHFFQPGKFTRGHLTPSILKAHGFRFKDLWQGLPENKHKRTDLWRALEAAKY